MVAVTNLLDLAFSAVLLPVWVKESGYSVGVMGASSRPGPPRRPSAPWSRRGPPSGCRASTSTCVAFLITGLPRFLLLALGVPLWIVLASCLVGGFASGFLNPILGAVIYERVPDAVMGRVTTLNTALCWSLMPFGGLLGGVLVGRLRLVAALLAVGFAYFAATMLPLAVPSFRQFDKPRDRRLRRCLDAV